MQNEGYDRACRQPQYSNTERQARVRKNFTSLGHGPLFVSTARRSSEADGHLAGQNLHVGQILSNICEWGRGWALYISEANF